MNEITTQEEIVGAAEGVGPYEGDVQERTPEIVAAEIRMYYEAGRRITMLCGIEIGRRLCEAKELVGHGEWLKWLEKETPFSDRHAQNYMRIFREYGADQMWLFGPETNAKYISDMPISKALLLLSVPESDREEFAQSVDAETLSEKELKEEIRKLKEANEILAKDRDEMDGLRAKAEAEAKRAAEGVGPYKEKLAEAEKVMAELSDDVDRYRRQVMELEARPQPVAVERDEEAIREAESAARAQADEAWKKRLEAAQKDLEKAEKEKDAFLRTAQKEKEKLEKAKAEAEAEREKILRSAQDDKEELERVKKQLAASNKDMAEFGFHFKAVQRELAALRESLEAVKLRDPETGEKLAGALKKVLGPWVGVEV